MLLFYGFFVLIPLFTCVPYITKEGLWATTLFAFFLTKIGSMIGAFICMTMLWFALYKLQSCPDRNFRLCADKFFVQVIAPDPAMSI